MNKIDTSPAALRVLADPREYADTANVYAHTVEMRKALRAVAAEKEAQGWQPIETAPLDDVIDLWADGQRYTCCFSERGMFDCWLSDIWGRIKNPTHWMRVPQGPKT